MRRIDLKNFQVASSDVARDINRVVLLSLTRSCQPKVGQECILRADFQSAFCR